MFVMQYVFLGTSRQSGKYKLYYTFVFPTGFFFSKKSLKYRNI